MTERDTVLLVDDEPAILELLAQLLTQVGLAVCSFPSAFDLLKSEWPSGPTCVVTDLRMPGMSGTELQIKLRERGIESPIIILTGFGDVASAKRALKNGAFDFFEKGGSHQELIDSIQRAIAADRDALVRRAAVADCRARLATLSAREQDVLGLLFEGRSNREIAEGLGISLNTVEIHRSRVMKKLACDSVAQVVRLCLRVGFRQ